ncbi:outer membrane protein assembly factor BamA [Lysobacter pythonis]|uniref:Outer membrane protein assembly factor BamA n=1 Tax=Solilutibacter pythonis TaxID=2483112 RepID=A0A3M2HN47_9GAMM|nr:outer membrane protein assembly factor BamA [Lysobacter pythonis]RMH91136.1 outer membrane protein assembly factor BamA [Lysobacter pythonis]
MTRTPHRRRLLALALASALAMPALAQSIEPFTVNDIRVDGLQRISAGTVFTYLPVERGDRLDHAKAAEAIRALYKTGFFEDIRLDRQDGILVLTVKERPAINKLSVSGNKDLQTEQLMKSLKDIGLSEGETYDRMSLDRVQQELTRAYQNRGKYNVEIKPQVTRLDRNRVDIAIEIKEGKAAKIRHVNVIGNALFADKQLLDNWESRPTNWLSWYRRDDQYSKEKLSGDLEKLQSYYLDRGYIDAAVGPDNTQVSISPDKRDVYITAGISEGEQYKISSVAVGGDTVLPKDEVEKRVALFVQPDQVFSRARLEAATESITASLSNIGYAFAQVNPVPDVDREKRTVGITMQVVPGPRVSVRRIVFKDNNRTRDEVLRREMRQFEGAWYSQAAIDRSKIRLQQLGYFEAVDIESAPVPGSNDQVDLEVKVKETNSGQVMLSLGYSQLSGVQISGQLSENNFLGSGNRVSVAALRSYYQKRYEFSFLNPYFTDSGVSLGYNLWWSEFNFSNFNVAQYSTNAGAAQAFFGVPITEYDTVSLMLGIDSKKVTAISGSTPEVIIDYINAVGNRTFHSWRTQLAYARDTRNDALRPSAGTYQRVSLEATLPGSTVQYYKLDYQFSKYWPLSPSFVLNTGFNVGYGDSYGQNLERNLCYTPPTPPTTANPTPPPPRPPSNPCMINSADYVKTVRAGGLPFFENFYAGGVSSAGRVRGFMDNTLGPRVPSPFGGYMQPIGGSVKTIGTLEMFFPKLINSPAARVSAFVDFGNVFTDWKSWDAKELRASTGLSLMWRSPMGPISISYALPLRKKDATFGPNGAMIDPGDRIERLQFTFAGAF